MENLSGVLKTQWRSSFPKFLRYREEIFLVILNFITHFLFIAQYRFYSDDWNLIVSKQFGSYNIPFLLLESQRPLFYIIYKLQADLLGQDPLPYHILGFLTTTVILLLVYLIAKKIFSDFGHEGTTIPFLGAVLYCVLFNKDQLYPWAILCTGFPYLMYLLAWYGHLHAEKRYHLSLALITYLLGLLSYEVGIALPLVLISYDVIRKRPVWRSLMFLIPLGGYLVIRKTQWLGVGHVFIDRGFGFWNLTGIGIQTIFTFIYSIALTIHQITYAVIGLVGIGLPLLVLMGIIDLIVLIFIWKTMASDFSRLSLPPGFIAFILISIFAFYLPYFMSGGISTRHFVFIDVGVALLISAFFYSLQSSRLRRILITCTIGFCLILSQGLYANWVISGEIQENVARYIKVNSGDMKAAEYIYFNAANFSEQKPNQLADPITETFRNLFLTAVPAKESSLSRSTPPVRQYAPYLNAPCLDRWALEAMLESFVGPGTPDKLIYGEDETVLIEDRGLKIIIQKNYPDGETLEIDRSRIKEIRYFDIFTGLSESRDTIQGFFP